MASEIKTIWITGASSGIGAALARLLAQEGHRLVLSGRNTEKLQRVQGQCESGENVAILPMDLGASETMPALAQKAWELFGGIDILINNAGISQRSLISDTQMAVYRQLIEVNYLGTVALTKALLPYFLERGKGSFVTVTSLMGKFGSPLRSGYCGAKHALHGFFDVLRMEHQKDGIEVCLICPGFVQTEIAFNALTGDGTAQDKQDKATEAGVPPEEFAKRMWKAIQKGKWEAYIGGRETSGIWLKRFFPKLLHRVVLRSQVV
ncbi:Short-chain dehydrogenase [Robiginitalea myxolifaciens]|uniref:Short-chain dehydrogenase n=1 Tax=Robiginitalea myxolifaciens TaxID=400055 RepID=A0A1I6GTV4_9FLAO|nr:SDR family oxidoreductase [Robiginitalea myxolifaciens]SFR45674.1 Short-chain dehydrogenase [Robiginitalea myxolifaciens]